MTENSIYLNNATTSFPKSKIALDSFFRGANILPTGLRQDKSYLQDFRIRTGNLINISNENVFFTQSATIGLNQVIRGYIEDHDCLAIDNRSHNAVVRPWQYLSNKCECILATIYDEEDRFLQSNLMDILAKKPRLLCLTHVSNVNGSIYPIEEIIHLVNLFSPSTAILIDASQSAGAISLSVISKADFIVFSGHKHLHSLPGAAILIAKRKLKPIIFGGTGANSTSAEVQRDDDLFAEVGTSNLSAIMALVDSLEYAELKIKEHNKLINNLVDQFLDEINLIEDLKLIGRDADAERTGIVSIKPKFGSAEIHWEPFLRSQRILTRGGLHCSPLHHQQLGLLNSGTLRFSFGWHSKPEHVTKSILALKEFNAVARKIFI